jgi:dihydrofolate reductase
MINIITAVDLNNGLGFNNQLLAKLPNDMKHFRNLTENNFCIFGRKTYDSIGHSLPNRTNIILTRDSKMKSPEGTFVYNSLQDVIFEYENYNEHENELFICGGSEVYRQTLPYAQRIYLTIIDHTFSEVDTYFPMIDLSEWKVTENIKNKADENNPYDHYFVTYERRN